ncbi:MAG: helix-turn-helix transcriptional regulator [Prevotellaceae bacterium]|nr:helix-turn-helix transcriptional regulator [Prevotellaceae bacterium]
MVTLPVLTIALTIVTIVLLVLVVRSRNVLDKKKHLLTILIDRWIASRQQATEATVAEIDETEEAKEAEESEEAKEAEEAEEAAISAKSRELFPKIVKLMEDQQLYTDEDLNRDMIAEKLGTNYKYVVKAIKDCTGETLTAFINGYRMRHATRLLRDTDDSIAIIAEISGFSHRTLTRLFQAQFGITPSEYRKKSMDSMLKT